jgi:phosphinothricin acetyltransferase
VVSVRDAGADDVAAIRDIYAHHVLHGTGTFELDPPSLDEMQSRVEAVQREGLPYLVAISNDTTVGFAYAGVYRPRPAYRFTVEDSVYVAPDAAGTGTGTALLGAVIDRCIALGLKQMIAVIGDSDNTASIRLHEKHGFSRVGAFTDVGYKFDRWLDTVLMQRSLAQ